MLTDQELAVLKSFANALLAVSGNTQNDVLGLVPTPQPNVRRIFVKADGNSAWNEALYNHETGKYTSKPFGTPDQALKGTVKDIDVYFKKYEDGYGKEGDHKLVLTMQADFVYRIETGLFTASAMSLIDRLQRIDLSQNPIVFIKPSINPDKKTIVFFDVWKHDGTLILTTPDALNISKWQKQCVKIIDSLRMKLGLPVLSVDMANNIMLSASVDCDDEPPPKRPSLSGDNFKDVVNALLFKMQSHKIPNAKQKLIDLARTQFNKNSPLDLDPNQQPIFVQKAEAIIENAIKPTMFEFNGEF